MKTMSSRSLIITLLIAAPVFLVSCLGLFDSSDGGVEFFQTQEAAILSNLYENDIIYVAVVDSVFQAGGVPEKEEWTVLPGRNQINIPLNLVIGFSFDHDIGILFWEKPGSSNSGQFIIDLKFGTN